MVAKSLLNNHRMVEPAIEKPDLIGSVVNRFFSCDSASLMSSIIPDMASVSVVNFTLGNSKETKILLVDFR